MSNIEFYNSDPLTDMGSSPAIIKSFCDYLRNKKDTIQSVDIALYLFNNPYLLQTLKELASTTCRVTIYSIPIEGYDNNSQYTISTSDSSMTNASHTKYDWATHIYDEMKQNQNPYLDLRIVPHKYVRSQNVKPFSRGVLPYSMHIKTAFIQQMNDINCAFIFSSNLAVCDESKIESVYSWNLTRRDAGCAIDFFCGLRDNSISIKDFDPTQDYNHYNITIRPTPTLGSLIYTAPFYSNSPIIYKQWLINIIQHARNRIIVVGQHISDYKSTFRGNNNYGFLYYVLMKAKEGVQTTFLSQTYADPQGNDANASYRKPENKAAFVEFINAVNQAGNCKYYVHKLLHAKYIIIDNWVVFSTGNFTLTQFVYIPDVNIQSFNNIPNTSYSGIFCEFGAHYFVENQVKADEMENYTNQIICDPNTICTIP